MDQEKARHELREISRRRATFKVVCPRQGASAGLDAFDLSQACDLSGTPTGEWSAVGENGACRFWDHHVTGIEWHNTGANAALVIVGGLFLNIWAGEASNDGE